MSDAEDWAEGGASRIGKGKDVKGEKGERKELGEKRGKREYE